MRSGLLILLICFMAYGAEALAFDAANPYWFAVKPKLEKYLSENLDKNLYEYKILGPVSEMKQFLGNHPDSEIKFEKLNLNSPNDRKSVVASVYNSDGSLNDSIIINLEVQKYKDVIVVKNALPVGENILEGNTYTKRILCSSMDEKLYYNGSLKQKSAATNIAADTPLKVNMVRHEKLVKTGDVLKVSSGSKFIELGFNCKAAGSADQGETISLICPDIEKKNLKGVITSRGTARLL